MMTLENLVTRGDDVPSEYSSPADIISFIDHLPEITNDSPLHMWKAETVDKVIINYFRTPEEGWATPLCIYGNVFTNTIVPALTAAGYDENSPGIRHCFVQEHHYDNDDINAARARIGLPPVEEPEPVEETTTEETESEEQKTLPENPKIIDESSARFSGAPWFEAVHSIPVLVIGAGGIGSYVVFALSRIKPLSITVYDPDIVEEVNMAGQMYSNRCIGEMKVTAVRTIARVMSNYITLYGFHDSFNRYSTCKPVVLCGLDNMLARKEAFFNWKRQYKDVKEALFIDGRMSAENFQIFCIPGGNIHRMKEYEGKWLFTDAQADEGVCSYRQTSHVGMMIGGYMTSLFVNHVCNLQGFKRALPFFVEFNGTAIQTRIK